MEKKNTILLTMIAVATLLITVVGATFAYFGVTLQNNSKTVNISGSATSVGIITASTPNSAMHINLTGTEMAEGNIGKEYFSSTDPDVPYLETLTPAEVLNISVTGGDESLAYLCKVNFGFQKTSKDTMIANIWGNQDNSIQLCLGMTSDTNTDCSGIYQMDGIETESGVFIEEEIPISIDHPIKIYTAIKIINEDYEQEFANSVLDLEFKLKSIECKIAPESIAE